MKLPESILKSLELEYKEGVFPIIEIKLTGNVHFKQLTETIADYYNTPFIIVKLELEYIGKANFGQMIVHLKGNPAQNEQVVRYFNQSNIYNILHGYAA